MIVYDQPGAAGKRLIVLDEEQADYYERSGGAPEAQMIEWVRSWIPKDRTFVDIGAHAGTWSLGLADVVPHVEAFEPSYRTFCQLAGGIALNDLSSKIAIHRVALFDSRVGHVLLRSISQDRGGSSILNLPSHGPDNIVQSEEVELRTLDSYTLENVGFIKIDVEGAEQKVIAGALGTLRRCGWPTILFESWDPLLRGEWAGEIRRDLLAFIEQIGYRVIPVHGQPEQFLAERSADK